MSEGIRSAVRRLVIFLKSEPLFTVPALFLVFLTLLFPSETVGGILHLNYGTIIGIAVFIWISAAFELSGLPDRIAGYILGRMGGKIYTVPVLMAVSGLSAAFIMNDSALFVYIPLLKAYHSIIDEKNERRVIDIVYLTAAINIGSALTPFGNPQNIVVWKYYGIPIGKFIGMMLPFTFSVFSVLTLMYFIVILRGRDRISGPSELPIRPPVKSDIGTGIAAAVVLVINIITSGLDCYAVGALAAVIIFAAVNPKILRRTDLVLLLIFFLMFADVGIFMNITGTSGALQIGDTALYLLIIIISQLIGNIAASIIGVHITENPLTVLISSNIGGLGTITGSMANVIAVRLSGVKKSSFMHRSLPIFFVIVILGALYLNIGI